MAKHSKAGKGNIVGWFLRKLVTAPATWLGAVAGVAVGMPFADVSGLGAGIGMGSIVGIGAGVASYGIIKGIRAAYSKEGGSAIDGEEEHREEREQMMLAKLTAADLTDDADVLAKMLEARNAIVRRCAGPDVGSELSTPTLKLVSQLTDSALHRSAELLDLSQRMNDPLLDAPEGADETVEACRSDLVRAYRAIADSRSRILLHKTPSAEALLDEPADGADRGLGSLAERLEEETTILEGVGRRLRGLDLGYQGSDSDAQDEDSTTTYSPDLESES